MATYYGHVDVTFLLLAWGERSDRMFDGVMGRLMTTLTVGSYSVLATRHAAWQKACLPRAFSFLFVCWQGRATTKTLPFVTWLAQ